MQLIILGMHRSGTSVLARLLNMMGAYFGPEGISTGANQENPKGFWERRDVRQLNDYVLNSVGCDWNKISDFNIKDVPEEVINKFKIEGAKIILEMDSHRPWMLKEPRLCLLFDLWKELLERPVCIHIYRNPIEVANSLYTRNGIPAHTGIALWEKYNISALEASHGQPRFVVSHNKLMSDPVSEVKFIYEQLLNCGVDGVRLPSEKEITAFVRIELYREKVSDKEIAQFLNADQIKLFNEFKSGMILKRKNKFKLSNSSISTLEQYDQIEQQKKDITQQITQKEQALIDAQAAATKTEADLKQQLEQQKKDLAQQLAQKEQVINEAQAATTKTEADLKQQLEHQKKDLAQQLAQKEQALIDAQAAATKTEAELSFQHEKQALQLTLVKNSVLGVDEYITKQDETIKNLFIGIDALVTSRRWMFGNAIFSLRHKLLFRKVPEMATDYLKKIQERYQSIKTQSHPIHLNALEILDNELINSDASQFPLITESKNSVTDKPTQSISNADEYEFLDFGCSAGGSLELYGNMFQAEGKGLGLDINPEKVRLTKEKGYNAQVCDITKLQLNNKIKFGVMNHFLEHIPNIQDVNIIVKKACSIIDDFLLIRQPYYDADPYLFSNGFKFYWSNWRGHPNHMTLLEFHNMLMPLVTEGLIKSFSLYGMSPVTSSEDSAIHNIDSMIDQHGWNKKEHTPKRNIEFSIPVYKEVLAIVDLSGNSTDKVISKLKPFVKLYSSDNETTK